MKLKSLIAVFFSLVCILPASADFTDMDNSPYVHSVNNLVASGVIQGYDDHTFRPEQPINRAEFLKILLETKYKNHVSVFRSAKNNCFEDLPVNEAWFKVYACVAKNRKIIEGYPDRTFRASDTVNKAQAAKILYNVFFDPIESKSVPWYKTYYSHLKLDGIFLDMFNDEPGDLMTRGEMAFAIDQFSVYPSHKLSPPSVKPKETNIASLHTSSEAPRTETISVQSTFASTTKTPTITPKTLEISPLKVITSDPPGQQVYNNYISSYSQWQAAKYKASIENYSTSESDAQTIASEVLSSVNKARRNVEVKSMSYDEDLQAIAQNFAAHLVINAIYSHSDKLGNNPIERAKEAGIEGWVAESIVWRHRKPVQAIDWWKQSPTHWKNVSNPRFVRAGVGIAEEPNGGYIVVMLQGE